MPTVTHNYHRAVTLADTPITVSYYNGYMKPRREVHTTLGGMLGVDHIEWILGRPYPEMTALSKARGMWDSNQLDKEAAYDLLAKRIKELGYTPEVCHGE